MGKLLALVLSYILCSTIAFADTNGVTTADKVVIVQIKVKGKPTQKDNPAFKPEQNSNLPAKNCVAVIDTGLDYLHESFKGALFTNPNESEMSLSAKTDADKNGYAGDLHGWDFANNDPYPFDYEADPLELPMVRSFYELDKRQITKDEELLIRFDLMMNPFVRMMVPPSTGGHGTHVSGIVLKNEPKTCILPLKINFSWQQATEAVEYAAKMGVRVINMSFGSPINSISQSKQLEFDNFVATLKKHEDILFVTVSHNQGVDLDVVDLQMMPALLDLDNKITVGAVDKSGKLAKFSNISQSVDVYTLGADVESAQMGGGVVTMSGTSMAAPKIAGLAVKFFNERPHINARDVKSKILEISTPQELEHSSKKKFSGKLIL